MADHKRTLVRIIPWPWILGLTLLSAGCGGEVTSDLSSPEDGPKDQILTAEAAHLQWWNAAFTSQVWLNTGWQDTDLAVGASTAIQLRHASRLVAHGVYGWGYMPTFVDTVTGKQFRFLHLRPQYQWATNVGQTYPAGHVVGLSGGDTHDTGYPTYSTGPHLCVQTTQNFRTVFPAGSEGGGGGGGASCFSATLNRTMGETTCVQSSADGKWYTCQGGAWIGGQHGCGVTYPFCHSATLGRDVPARTCVQSRSDRVFYQCNHNGWVTPVANGAGPVGHCSALYGL